MQFNGPAASVAQNRQAALRASRPGGGVGPAPKPLAVDPRIDRITALMQRALHRRLTLCELAVATSLSVSRVCHLFKSHVGLSPARYLKLLRLQRAKELLETSVFSVKEIGVRLSYGDPSQFEEDVRKTFGLPPLRNRRRASQATDATATTGR